MKAIIILTLATISLSSFAGELVSRSSSFPRSDFLKDGCRWVHEGSRAFPSGDSYQLYRDMSLYCGQQTPPILTKYATGTTTCAYKRGLGAAGYDISLKRSSCDLMVSETSAANAFIYRPLSSHYQAFSRDGVLDKPVIIVGGYDPKDDSYPAMYYEGVGFGSGFRSLIDDYSGRDLIIVQFDHGAADLSDNASVLESIIQEVNAAKLADHPNALIGYSMGGIIARKALRNMEMAGLEHEVSVYVSYDSPHLGANIPAAIPDTINEITRDLDKVFGYTPEPVRKARYYYTSPAARQMLLGSSELQPAAFKDFPKKPVRIGVSNGSVGTATSDPNLSNNDLIAQFDITYMSHELIGSWSSDRFVWKSTTRDGHYYDNMQGSYMRQFDDAFDGLQESADVNEYYPLQAGKRVTFVPTFSALAIQDFPVDQGARPNDFFSSSPFDKYIVDDGWSSCTRTSTSYSRGTGYNRPHEYFAEGVMNKIRCALTDYHRLNYVVPDRSGKVYPAAETQACGANSGRIFKANVSAGLVSGYMPAATQYCGSCGVKVTGSGYDQYARVTITCGA